MIVIPALDVRDGQCIVSPASAAAPNTSVAGNIFSIARNWASAGFQRLHIRDVNAVEGNGSNEQLMDELVRQADCDIQVAGDIQTTEQVQRFVDCGVLRVVVGHRAIEEPDWLAHVSGLFPGLVVVSTRVHERRVVTRGWVRNLPLDILDVVEELGGLPLGGLLVSTAQADAARSAADLALLEDVAEICEFPLLARGGISGMNDLRALEHRGISAVLLGEPLYSGALDSRAVAQEFGQN